MKVKGLRWRKPGEFNPVLVKELRGQVRGARAFVMLTVYLGIMTCFTSVVYAAYSKTASTPGSVGAMAYAGKTLFSTVVLLEIALVAFLTPALAAGAISGERERKTYELLRTTLLPARRLVLGKLGAALTYMLLLILVAIPLESLAFVLGGVEAEELLLALVILVVTAFTVAALGLFVSSLTRTTLTATVITYAAVLVMTVGMPLLLGIVTVVGTSVFLPLSSASVPSWFEIVLTYLFYFLLGLNPITAAVLTETALVNDRSVWFMRFSLGYRSLWLPSGWIVYTVFYLVVSVVLVVLTVRRVRRRESQ